MDLYTTGEKKFQYLLDLYHANAPRYYKYYNEFGLSEYAVQLKDMDTGASTMLIIMFVVVVALYIIKAITAMILGLVIKLIIVSGIIFIGYKMYLAYSHRSPHLSQNSEGSE